MLHRVLLAGLTIVGGAVAIRILLQFRGLPMPVLPRRAGGRARRVLRVLRVLRVHSLSIYVALAYNRYHRVRSWEQFRVQRRRDARAAGILAAVRGGGGAGRGGRVDRASGGAR